MILNTTFWRGFSESDPILQSLRNGWWGVYQQSGNLVSRDIIYQYQPVFLTNRGCRYGTYGEDSTASSERK